MRSIFTIGFLAVFGTYGLGLAGILEDPKGLAELDMKKLHVAGVATPDEKKKPSEHYTLKAMR